MISGGMSGEVFDFTLQNLRESRVFPTTHPSPRFPVVHPAVQPLQGTIY